MLTASLFGIASIIHALQTKRTGWFLGMGLIILIGCNSPQIESFQQAQTKEAAMCLGQGNALSNEGKYAEAINAYSKAIELNPKLYEAFIKRGDLFCREQKEYDKALVDFNRAIEISSKKPDAYIKLAGVYLIKDDTDIDKAISIINKMLEVNSGDIAVCAYGRFMRAGLYFYFLRDYDKTIVDLTYIIDSLSELHYKEPICGLSYDKFVKTCN